MIKVLYPCTRITYCVRVLLYSNMRLRVYLLKYLTNIYCKRDSVLQLYADTVSAYYCNSRTRGFRKYLREIEIFCGFSFSFSMFIRGPGRVF